jgi:hypothetical protein
MASGKSRKEHSHPSLQKQQQGLTRLGLTLKPEADGSGDYDGAELAHE